METKSEQRWTHESDVTPFEVVTRWGLVALASAATIGALLRMFSPLTADMTQRLDQTTLLYLGVAGLLLLLRQVKTFAMGHLKLEMIEKIRERQDEQAERLASISLILPLLLARREVDHIKNLASRTQHAELGSHELRAELRRLASIGLVDRRPQRHIADIKDGVDIRIMDYVDLTTLGRRWATRIQEIEASGA